MKNTKCLQTVKEPKLIKMEGIRVKELCMKFLQVTPDSLKIFSISENNVGIMETKFYELNQCSFLIDFFKLPSNRE